VRTRRSPARSRRRPHPNPNPDPNPNPNPKQVAQAHAFYREAAAALDALHSRVVDLANARTIERQERTLTLTLTLILTLIR